MILKIITKKLNKNYLKDNFHIFYGSCFLLLKNKLLS